MNKANQASKSKKPANPAAHTQGTRETVESFVVAIILAFLFKTFIAEAFVIPTGSMAPTLMGAHKDISCQQCGYAYQAGASSEYNEVGFRTDSVVVASVCPICRSESYLDLRNNPNDRTFNGDRILVSKFDYAFGNPNRWDVIVFKFPGDARMNYIKRLIGLPKEKILVKHGDIYTKTETDAPFQIARKPPTKILATLQAVSDTDFRSPALVEAGWPSDWQPWSPSAQEPPKEGWNVTHTPESWSAKLTAEATGSSSDSQAEASQTSPFPQDVAWLRYFHRFPVGPQWPILMDGGKIEMPHPYSSTLITDFSPYNSSISVNRSSVYQQGKLLPSYVGGVAPYVRKSGGSSITRTYPSINNDGLHWVSDLCVESNIKISGNSGEVWLTLVESGIHFVCVIDISTGVAKLTSHYQGRSIEIETAAAEKITSTTAVTSLKGTGSYHIQFANVDDQIVLWVNNKVVPFEHADQQGAVPFDLNLFRTPKDDRPHWTAEDPLDAAPIGIGGRGVELQLDRLQVWRDIYYIAVENQSSLYSDYRLNADNMINSFTSPETKRLLREQTRQVEISNGNDVSVPISILHLLYGSPEEWNQTTLFENRNTLIFEVGEDQFFPMGDNSAASFDARGWSGQSTLTFIEDGTVAYRPTPNSVKREYMIGKALMVFWPHTWARPIPFLPNFKRMGLIR